jgi:hypothetical protein
VKQQSTKEGNAMIRFVVAAMALIVSWGLASAADGDRTLGQDRRSQDEKADRLGFP